MAGERKRGFLYKSYIYKSKLKKIQKNIKKYIDITHFMC